MNCKHCGAELEEGLKACPVCGKEIEAEPEIQEAVIPETMPELEVTDQPVQESEDIGQIEVQPIEETVSLEEAAEEASARKKPKVWMIILAILGGIVLVGVLVCAILYGLGYDFKPKENDIYFRECYTVEDDKATKQADTVVATAGDRELTNSQLQVYYWMTVVEFVNNYSYYLSAVGLDYTAPLDQQTCYFDQTMTWEQFFLSNAVSTWHRYSALRMLAEEENFVLSEDLQQIVASLPEDMEADAVAAGYANAQEMIRDELGAACTTDGYVAFWTDYYTGLGYFDGKYVELMPTDEEAEAYFNENEETLAASGITKDAGRYVDVRHILIQPEGGTTDESGTTTIYSEEAWVACLEEAQKVYDEWKNGEANEESFAAMALQYSEDGGSSTNGGLYEDVTPGYMVEEFDAWIQDASRQPGDHDLVKTKFGYHIMYFVSGEDIWLYETKSTLLTERTTALVETGLERWPMEVNYRKIVLGEASLG